MTALQNFKIRWLSRARSTEQQISAIQAVQKYDFLLMEKLNHCQNPSACSLSDYLESRQKEIFLKLTALAQIREEIRCSIEQVQNPEFRCLLLRKYLAYETNEQIAEAMHYDIRTIQRKHKKALDEISVPSEVSISETTIFRNISCEN